MILTIYLLVLIVVMVTTFWQGSLLYAALTGTPIVYAWERAIRDSLQLAALKKGETVVDLGCGNAKVLILAARKFGAKGVGVDRSIWCYLKSITNVWLAGQSKNIQIIRGDFKKADKFLGNADVVYVYLLNDVMANIKEWLFSSISKDARVVSLSFVFPGKEPVREANTYNIFQNTKVRLYKK